jgi:hypothetical protein
LIVFAAICVFWTVRARAEGGAVLLQWSAPEGCADRGQILAETSRLLGDTRADRTLVARGVISRTARGFALELSTELGESRGARRLKAARCADLTQPAALVLALAIDPNALARAVDPSVRADGAESPSSGSDATSLQGAVTSAVASLPPVDAAAPPRPAPLPAQEPARSAPKAARPKQSKNAPPVTPSPDDPRLERRSPTSARSAPSAAFLRLGAGGALDIGTLPDAGWGAVAIVAGGYERIELEARGALYASQAKAVGASAGGDLSLLSAGLAACYRALDIGSVSPCAGAEGSRLSGTGVGVSDPSSGAVWIWSGVVGARAAHPVSETVALWVRLDALAALNQPRFVLENVGAVHEPARVSARAGLGAEVRFP